MVVEIYPTCCNGGSEDESEEREGDFLGEVKGLMTIWAFGAIVLSRGMMAQ